MTAIKRCCALALAVLMILTALPVTAFAQAAEQEVNASLQETTVSGIANDIARQVLRSGQKNGEKIQMENTAKLDDSDEVEIIVVVNDSVADPDSRAQVNALLRTQKSALAQINRAIDGQVEPSGSIPPCSTAFPPQCPMASTRPSGSWTACSPPSFPPPLSCCPTPPTATG